MDQLNADCYELNGQIYRRNVPLEKVFQTQTNINSLTFNNNEEDEFSSDDEELKGIETKDELDNDYKILAVNATNSDRINYDQKKRNYYSLINVPSALIDHFVNRKKKVVKSIEETSKVKIILPSINENKCTILEIQGEKVDQVEDAISKIEFEIYNARQNHPPTCFVSVMLKNDVNFCKRYEQLLNDICSSSEIAEVYRNKKLYTPVEKLHLTLCVLRIFTEEDEIITKECLNNFFQTEALKILNNQRYIDISFNKLKHFGRSRMNARVLYVSVTSNLLLEFGKALQKTLKCTGFSDSIELILHMTILNVKHTELKFLDVTEILNKFENFCFPDVRINEIEICVINETDLNTNSYPVKFNYKL